MSAIEQEIVYKKYPDILAMLLVIKFFWGVVLQTWKMKEEFWRR